MSEYFSAHARERAQERYGLDLSAGDMLEILRACQDGRASRMQATHANGGVVFVWSWKGKTVLPLVGPAIDFIITFEPDRFFVKSERSLQVVKRHRKGMRHRAASATNKYVDGHGDYNRARVTREAMRDEDEA